MAIYKYIVLALTQCCAPPIRGYATTPVVASSMRSTPGVAVSMTPPVTGTRLRTTIVAPTPPQADTTTYIIVGDTTTLPPQGHIVTTPPQSDIFSTPPETVLITTTMSPPAQSDISTPPETVLVTTTMPPPPQTGRTTGGQPAATTTAADGCYDKQGSHKADDEWADKEKKVKKVCVNHPKAGYYIATTACLHGDDLDKEAAVYSIVKIDGKSFRCQYDQDVHEYALAEVEAGDGRTSCTEVNGSEHEPNDYWLHNATMSMCRFNTTTDKYSIERVYCYHCEQYALPKGVIKCEEDGKRYKCVPHDGMLYVMEVSGGESKESDESEESDESKESAGDKDM